MVTRVVSPPSARRGPDVAMRRRRWCVDGAMARVVVILLVVVAELTAAASVECERQVGAEDRSRTDVVCRTAVLEAGFSVTRHVTPPVTDVTSLTLHCDGDGGTESRLTNRTLRGLPALRTLGVERCRLTRLPAGVLGHLSRLTSLSLRTFSDNTNLVVDSGALDGLQALQHLDLSHSQLWGLPVGLLCPLQTLQGLNLSHNHLQEADGLGLRWPDGAAPSEETACRLPALTTLDLSHNRLPTVDGRLLAALPALRQLSLRSSRVELLADGALDGLAALEHLDLSGNELVTVARDLLSGTRRLSELLLADNRLSALTPGTFQQLGRLRRLDLSGNQLTSTWISSQTFSGLGRLQLLDISDNRLDQLDPSMFADLRSLRVLRLHHNQIDALAPNTFTALSSLHTLVLSHNKLQRIGPASLKGLTSLASLSLDDNRIDIVQNEAFMNISNLRELKLNGNRLTRVPEAFQNLHQLERLDLANNYISDATDDAFSGMDKLYDIRLETNMLTNVTRSLLRNFPQLRVFNLADNLVGAVEQGAFASTPQLEAIRLDGNRLTDISSAFHGLNRLRWLNISDNQIEMFDYAMLPRSVQWLDLHQNKIEELGNYFDVADQMSLTTLDVSFNRLTSLSGKSLPSSAELLSLNDNLITHVEQYTFFLMANLSRVDLFANQLKSLEINALRLNRLNDTSVPAFYIGGNPFVCDCEMEWLQRYHQINQTHNYPKISDLESIYCRLVYSRERAFVPLVDADTSMFLCPYKTHCFTTCHCCAFDACDCEMTCPAGCSCYHDQSWSSNIIDCSSRDLEEIPDRLPMDATEVYLDGNVISNLSSLTFLGRKNMRRLFLNGSQIEVIQNETFSGLERLTVLHLESNAIAELGGHEFVGLDQLRELHLQNNRLCHVAEETFAPLTQLEVLRLEGNRLATFPAWQLRSNAYLVEIGLGGNRWSCHCDFLTELRSWLTTSFRKVTDVGSLVCRLDGDQRGPAIYENSKCLTLPDEQGSHFSTTEYVVIVACTLLAVAMLVCLLVLVSVYRTELRVWLYWRCGVRVCHRSSADQQPHRLFDAFVSYSERDRSFVQHVLVPRLEGGEPPYRLALPDRDFAHSAYLADTIVEAVESSRRTHHGALQELCGERVVPLPVQVGAPRAAEGPAEAAHCDPSGGRVKQMTWTPTSDSVSKPHTCVRWGDKRFWERLLFALPDVKNLPRPATPESLYEEIGDGGYYQRSPSTMETIWG